MDILNTVVLVTLCVVGSSTLIAMEFFSHLVINPTCCAEHLPSRATNKEWESLRTPNDVGIVDAVKVKFNSKDAGRDLEGWLLPAAKGSNRRGIENDGVLAVLVHDSGADMRQVLELSAGVQKNVGWASLIFNTQETKVSHFGRSAASDVLSAVAYVRSGVHQITKPVRHVVVMGISVGAAAGMFASIKDTSVDVFVPIGMPASPHQFWQSGIEKAIEELQHSVRVRQADNITVDWQAIFSAKVAEMLYTPSDNTMVQKSAEQSTFMARLEEMSKGWFVDLAAHFTVIRGAGYRAWLQGITDPHKVIHRLQPRGLFLVHSKGDKTTPLPLVQSMYNRAGTCNPKLARIQMDGGDEIDLRQVHNRPG